MGAIADSAVLVWFLFVATLANSIASLVYSSHYIDETVDGARLGTSNMFYSTVFIRGLAGFTGIAALSYLLLVWVDSRHRMAKRKQQKVLTFSFKRLQNSRIHNYTNTDSSNAAVASPDPGTATSTASTTSESAARAHKAWLKKSQKGRRILLVFTSIFLILWIVPSVLLYAQGWSFRFQPSSTQSAPTADTTKPQSACIASRHSQECQRVVEVGVSATFQCLWLLLIIASTLVTLLIRSKEPDLEAGARAMFDQERQTSLAERANLRRLRAEKRNRARRDRFGTGRRDNNRPTDYTRRSPSPVVPRTSDPANPSQPALDAIRGNAMTEELSGMGLAFDDLMPPPPPSGNAGRNAGGPPRPPAQRNQTAPVTMAASPRQERQRPATTGGRVTIIEEEPGPSSRLSRSPPSSEGSAGRPSGGRRGRGRGRGGPPSLRGG